MGDRNRCIPAGHRMAGCPRLTALVQALPASVSCTHKQSPIGGDRFRLDRKPMQPTSSVAAGAVVARGPGWLAPKAMLVVSLQRMASEGVATALPTQARWAPTRRRWRRPPSPPRASTISAYVAGSGRMATL